MPPPNSELQTPNAKIYLTGFMGSGKSTVGPLVARRLGRPFLDLDDVIAEAAGRAIPAIFAHEGEAGFRRREAEALRQIGSKADGAVVATGGGTLVREENLQCALESGFVVYLQAPAAVLARRLREAAAERPLLHGASGRPPAGPALTRRIETLLSERRSFYEQAHATVRTAAETPEEAAAAVARAFRTAQ